MFYTDKVVALCVNKDNKVIALFVSRDNKARKCQCRKLNNVCVI